jgi:hypothetical protein
MHQDHRSQQDSESTYRGNITRRDDTPGVTFSGGFRELVERAAVAFDDAVANLLEVDIFQNNGPAISAFERQTAAGPDRLAPRDSQNYASSQPSLSL